MAAQGAHRSWGGGFLDTSIFGPAAMVDQPALPNPIGSRCGVSGLPPVNRFLAEDAGDEYKRAQAGWLVPVQAAQTRARLILDANVGIPLRQLSRQNGVTTA
jgi:hypothetical protein